MSTELTSRQKALVVGLCLLAISILVAVGMLLRENAPGNMGNGFLGGAAVATAACAVMAWRVTRRPERATTFERGWTQSGDERDDAVLTRSLAVLGILAVPATGAAAIVIALGARAIVVLTVLLFAQLAVLAVTFTVTNRRS